MTTINNSRAKELKKDFPIFKVKMSGKPLVYLDNAATTQKPFPVIKSIERYYRAQNANIHRGVYPLSEKATELFEQAHAKVGSLIGAKQNEIIFTRNATESLNLLAYSLPSLFEKGRDEIVLTEMEHHSNMVPWQQLARRRNMKLRYIRMKDGFTLDYGDAEEKISDKSAVVAAGHVSNALGTVHDVKRLAALARANGAFSVVDGAQSVPHQEVDVGEIGCDFLAFSGHKMAGPTGMGALYGRKQLLENMAPFNFGGDMIRKVSYESAEWNELPMKFEAGTPNIAGGIGFGVAVDYLENTGLRAIGAWESELLRYALDKIKGVKGVSLFTPGVGKSSGILSFNIDGIHAHDVASLLGGEGVCIRGGHHCAMPLMGKLGVAGTSRVSFYLYNTYEDVDIFIQGLRKAKKVFGV